MTDINNTVSISSETIETIIGAQTKFKGNVKTDKPLRIDGYFEGIIDSSSLVLISECGSFKGNLSCVELQLVGSGEGTANCSQLLQMAATGKFVGDVQTKDLITVPGSVLNGNCKMIFNQQ